MGYWLDWVLGFIVHIFDNFVFQALEDTYHKNEYGKGDG